MEKETVNGELTFKVTPVFQKNLEAFNDPDVKIIVNQGGTRSSKTYSIAQLFIIHCLQNQKETITISRKTSPSLRASVMRDFFEILNSQALYSQENHNKTEREYRINQNLIEFVSMDMPQKKRGTKRDHLWLNEANEFDFEDYFQMMIRTAGKIFIDYNPSDEFHWIYDKVIPRDDCRFIKSTYKDNPFLDQSLVDEIVRLKDIDENYWKIYGLGEVGKRKAIIYDNWDLIDEFPENIDEFIYGEDFGYNNPSVIVKVGIKDQMDIYVDEIIYESNLTNTDLIERMKGEGITRKNKIMADSAEPDRIEEIQRAGFLIDGCKKGKNSVKDGIDLCKRKRIHITKRSVNTQKEIRSYKWKEDKAGNILDEPVAFNDHAMSAMRYAVEDFIFDDGLMGQIMKRQTKDVTINVVRSSPRAQRERQQTIQNNKMGIF